MIDVPYKFLLQYLNQQGIKQVECFDIDEHKDRTSIDERRVKQHLEVLSEFHYKAIGYNGYMSNRIENHIGRQVEQYKTSLKKLKRDVKNIKIKGCGNRIETLILDRGEEYILRAEKSIEEIYSQGYIEVINRSMKWSELCLGDTGLNNLRKQQEIEIIDIRKCCYDIVEMDGFFFFHALKKKGVQFDWEELAGYFCELEKLEENSKRIIMALLSYPSYFMRICNRYRENKKMWSERQYIDKFEKAMTQDGQSVI